MAQAWGDEKTKFFFELTPERVLDAVEAAGLQCTGRCSALGSFENRVYEIELEEPLKDVPAGSKPKFCVAKFYRPGRWTQSQILEEHAFLLELAEQEIPVVSPLKFPDGTTLRLSDAGGIWYALFPKVGGRSPDEMTDEQLERVGRLLARIHAVGSARPAKHRIRLDASTYGRGSLDYLLEGEFIPPDLVGRYTAAARAIIDLVGPWFDAAGVQRVHGDCHPGNLLWNDLGPFFLDFDDMVRGPCVQDLWLVVPGRDRHAKQQFEVLLQSYEQLRDFDRSTLRLIEPLRSLRFIHFSAWIAKRWEDPAFPGAFPHFGTHKYWSEQTQDLEDQLRLIQDGGGRDDQSEDDYTLA